MWNVLPKFGLVKLVILLVTVVATSGLAWYSGGWFGFVAFLSGAQFVDATKLVVPISLTCLAIAWFLGAWLWKFFWNLPWLGKVLDQKVCPNLNGTWTGFTESTLKDEEGRRIKTSVELTIKASFFGFDMSLKSVNGYQKSKVIQSEIYKDPRDGSFQISYVFESVVDIPEPTDDSRFDGAAKLSVRFENDEIKLVGTYWTNRAWQRGQNTAGSIFLARS